MIHLNFITQITMNRKFSHKDLAMISGVLSIIGSIVFMMFTN
jgi:hypothetical protein